MSGSEPYKNETTYFSPRVEMPACKAYQSSHVLSKMNPGLAGLVQGIECGPAD